MSRDILLAAGAYVLLLIVLGAAGRKAMSKKDLSDFYLAGRSLGLVVLLLTLFATQYSGNSLSGFPGQTYRRGLAYFMSVTFMVAIVSGYTLFAPRLVALARRERFVTPSDYLSYRFGNSALSQLASVIFCLTLINFLLAQLMALGHAFAGVTDGAIPYPWAVAVGALVILAYEALGGMRAVAWTDVAQGVILAVGLSLIVLLLFVELGLPPTLIARVAEVAPEKVANPTLETCLVWTSNLILLGLGAPMYPQAIQRLYAARSTRTLRKALVGMSFIPLFAITTVVLIGIAGIVLFPDLSATESDQVTFRVLAHLVEVQPLAYLPVLIVMMAVLAAIMSTADSSLLSLGSILAKDLVGPRIRSIAGDSQRLTRLGTALGALVLAILVVIAIEPIATLWGLLVIKFEILIQLSPAFLLGVRHRRDDPRGVSARDILPGVAIGLAVALGLYAAGYRSLAGLHAGIWGVACNYGFVLASWRLRRS